MDKINAVVIGAAGLIGQSLIAMLIENSIQYAQILNVSFFQGHTNALVPKNF